MSQAPLPLQDRRPESSRYDVLFEPVRIGPLTTKNRFFQVPHCNGMGYRDPSAQAAMRRVKAEGGWAVVCTEQVEIHPTSDIAPFIELRIWDDQDVPGAGPHRRGDPRGRRAGRHRTRPQRPQRPEPVQPRDPARPCPPAGRDVHLRPGPGAGHDEGRHRRPAPLAPQRGAQVAAGGLRPGIRLCRARARRHPPLPVPALQPAQRRVRRQPAQPDAAAAGDPRGHPGRGRWPRGGRVQDHGRRAHRRGRHRPPSDGGDPRRTGRASRTCGTS